MNLQGGQNFLLWFYGDLLTDLSLSLFPSPSLSFPPPSLSLSSPLSFTHTLHIRFQNLRPIGPEGPEQVEGEE